MISSVGPDSEELVKLKVFMLLLDDRYRVFLSATEDRSDYINAISLNVSLCLYPIS